MKNLILFLLIFVQALTVHAANIGDDTVNIGQKGSTGDKALIFRDANQTSLSVEHLTSIMSWGGDQFKIGDGTNSDKKYVFDVGAGANNPFFLWNSTKNKLGFSNDGTSLKDIGSGSGGGGGENFNNGFGSDDNANAEDGTTGWTNTGGGTFTTTTTDTLEGDQSFTFTASAQNDEVLSPVLSFDKDLFRGNNCEARIEYIGGDDNLELHVVDGNGDILNEDLANNRKIPARSTFGTHSVFFQCPRQVDITGDAQKGNLQYVVKNVGASAAPLIKFDKSYMGTLRGLSETTLPDVVSGNITCSSSSSVNDDGDFLSSVGNISGGQCSVTWTPGVFSVAPECQLTGSVNTSNGVSMTLFNTTTSGATFECILDNGGPCGNISANVMCKKKGADAKQKVQVFKAAPVVRDTVNTLDFKVSSSATIIRDQFNILTGCSNSGSTLITCNFVAGVFTNSPNCSATIDDGSSTHTVYVRTTSPSISSLTLEYSNSTKRNVVVRCTKQDGDYEKPQTKNISLNGIAVNTYAESSQRQVRVETCNITVAGNTASAYCGWISNVSNSATGQDNVTFAAGTFSTNPDCYVVKEQDFNADNANCWAGGPNTASVGVYCRNQAIDSAVDRDYFLLCVGEK